MTKLSILVLVALAVTTCRADLYTDAVFALNPLFYWRLADSSAAVGPGMPDSTGSGTAFGQTAVAPLTTDAGSTSFSGGGIRTPGFVNRYPSGSTGYTTCFWANFDVSPPPDFRSIVGDGNNAVHWYMMVYLSPFGKIRTHNYPGIYDSVSTVTTGQDYFICTMWDQAAGKIRFYINGALDSEQSTTTAAPDVARSTTGKMYIGADDRVPGVSGRIDEVSFFNRPLSPTEIASLYAPPTPVPPTPVPPTPQPSLAEHCLVAEFSTTANPNNHWSYGKRTTPNINSPGAFSLLTQLGSIGWNNGGTYPDVKYAGSILTMATSNTQESIARYTADVDQTAHVTVTSEDHYPAQPVEHKLLVRKVSGTSVTNIAGPWDSKNTISQTFDVTLAAGDSIELTMFHEGSGSWDRIRPNMCVEVDGPPPLDPAVEAFCDDIAQKCIDLNTQCNAITADVPTQQACLDSVAACDAMEQDCRDKIANCPIV